MVFSRVRVGADPAKMREFPLKVRAPEAAPTVRELSVSPPGMLLVVARREVLSKTSAVVVLLAGRPGGQLVAVFQLPSVVPFQLKVWASATDVMVRNEKQN